MHATLHSLTGSLTNSLTQTDNPDDIVHYGLARKHKKLAVSNRLRHALSTVPFWCGEYRTLTSCFISFLRSKDLKFLLVNSDLLSLRRRLILPNGAVSDKNVYVITSKVSLFCLRKYTMFNLCNRLRMTARTCNHL